jgi:predicted HicB family RNase H-like nuclease
MLRLAMADGDAGVRPVSPSEEPTQPFAVLSTRISPQLHRRTKRWAVETGESMQRIVEAALTAYLDAQRAP